jgi:hypothetical protein
MRHGPLHRVIPIPVTGMVDLPHPL